MLISLNSLAQWNGEWIESGQMKLRINADGQLATYNNRAASEMRSGSNNHLFKFINIWISGYYKDTQLRITSVNGYNYKSDYSPGPLNTFSYIAAEPNEWNFVWHVSSEEINDHRSNYRNNGYEVADAIKNWPANGPEGYHKHLAPFIDYDKNGIYEPIKGDYPDIIGHKAAFFIVNDNYSEHKASGGQPLNIELYGMLYALSNIPNTVFGRYYIMNRTDKDLSDVKVSVHTGFQLGNERDNYIGTIVPQNMIFAYNGDENDENHFGLNKPLASVMILNKELSSSLYVTNDSNLFTGMPLKHTEHRNMMEGKWRNGAPITFGNAGTTTGNATQYVYPGVTDPKHPSENWQENNVPGERSVLANMSYPTLLSKDFIELDLAISGVEKSEGNAYTVLQLKALEIKNLWAKAVLNVPKIKIEESNTLKNPIREGENIYEDWFQNYDVIYVLNNVGQTKLMMQPKNKIELILNEKGVYYIKFKRETTWVTKKIVVL